MPHKPLIASVLILAAMSASRLELPRAFALEQSKQQEIERLSSQLATGEPGVQRKAAIELSYFGNDGILPLINALRTFRDEQVLDAVVQALGSIGEAAVPFITKTLHDENSGTRNALKNIAQKRKRGFPDAVPELMQILQNKALAEAEGASDYDLQDSDAAADCLAYFGRDAEQAVPLLIELLPNERNRKSVNHYQKLTAIISIIEQL